MEPLFPDFGGQGKDGFYLPLGGLDFPDVCCNEKPGGPRATLFRQFSTSSVAQGAKKGSLVDANRQMVGKCRKNAPGQELGGMLCIACRHTETAAML